MSFKASYLASNQVNADTDTTVSVASLLDAGYTYVTDSRFGYKFYSEYDDEAYSIVNDLKNIVVDPSQINITQETNSQFIPFKIKRYWDGIDLTDKLIQIHYYSVTAEGGNYVNACDVMCNDEYIYFAWLVTEEVTAYAGDVLFEIVATGTNELNETYVWKSRPNGKITVLQALTNEGVIVPTGDSYTTFVTTIMSYVAEAKEYADSAKASADSIDVDLVAENVREALDDDLTDKITEILKAYYTQAEIDLMLTEINNTISNIDGLAKFNVDYNNESGEMSFKNGTTEIKKFTINSLNNLKVSYKVTDGIGKLTFYNGTSELVSVSIGSIDPSENWVKEYDAKVDSKINDAVNPLSEQVNTLATDVSNNTKNLADNYYTKTQVDTAINAVDNVASTNKDNIGLLGNKVTELSDTVAGINMDPSATYEATYDQNVYTLWEITGEGTEEESRTAKGSFTITGGGGGGTTSNLKITYVSTSPVITTSDGKALITYNFSGEDSSGDAVTSADYTWKIGSKVIATGTCIAGDNTFDATEFISIGSQKLLLSIKDDNGTLVTKSWTVQVVDISISSTFNDKITYPMGTVSFDYTPYGAISKTVHFLLDGEEIDSVTTTASAIPMSYIVPAKSHGAHLLEAYITAEINGLSVESNHIVRDILWVDENSELPVIGCVANALEINQYDTENIVYTVYSPATETPTVTLAVDGEVVSILQLVSATNTWQYKPTEVGQKVLTITCGDTTKTIDVNVKALDIDNEPVTAGLVVDFNPVGMNNNSTDRLWSNGTVAMSVSDNFDWVAGGYQIDENGDQYFGIKAGTTATFDYHLFGDDAKKTGKEFKIVYKTENVRNIDSAFLSCLDSNVGLEMKMHEANFFAGSVSELTLPYSEEDIIEFEFNISKNTDLIPMVMGYEDGVATRPLIYKDTHTFTQDNPQDIVIGSPDCDVRIYRMRIYNTSLTDRGILSNFIADARTADEMVARYNRNQIYDENGQLTPESLANACPDLRVLVLEVPYFTNNKSDKVVGGTLTQIYKNGDPILDNWTAYNIVHNGQGTTSNEYGAAGRNLEFNVKEEGAYFILGDGETQAEKISFTRESVPTNYMNLKVNIASSENENNALGQKHFGEFDPYIRPARLANPMVKDIMEFHNAVLFIRETDDNVETHREFKDTNLHYYALGNIGDSKKTDKTRLDDKDDPLEHVVEIADNTLPNSTFPKGEAAIIDLEADKFDGDGTYEFRYIKDKTDPEVISNAIAAWQNFYKFVVNSTDEEFKNNLKDYFVVDTALFHYLMTTYFIAIDNRAKNTFWHYSKNADGVYRYDLAWAYDWDSTLGINNSGELTMTYGYEDTDYKTKGDASTGYAYNAATSTFFCRIRDLFADELKDMYISLESANCWNASSIIAEYDTAQNQFPEELWRVDYQRKYIRSYQEGSPRFLTTMMQGRKKYQRRQFLRDQEIYMASKFLGNTIVADQIMFRCNTPTDENLVVKPKYDITIVPYMDMYLNIRFGANYLNKPVRARAGETYTIKCPYTTMDDTAVLIYGASRIQAINDISGCYIHDNDFSKASKLKELVIGNSTYGYANNFLTQLGIGNNALLEKLDISNTPNLKQSLDLSSCPNLQELYANGSGLTGIIFANGGQITIAKLDSLGSISMKNLNKLTDLDVKSYAELTSLVVENCSTVDVIEILNAAINVGRVRITGINWNLESDELLNKLYGLKGIDVNGYNTAQSVLAGIVHLPYVREKLLEQYQQAWPDLEITYDTLIEQFTVTFVNDDENETVLDVQYIDKGEDAVDPMTRAANPIPTPAKQSTVSAEYVFEGWDDTYRSIFRNRTIRATYTEKVRSYTIRYLSMGTVLQSTVANYGDSVVYEGTDPVYTAQEVAYKYYLFKGWDASGYVSGDKDINATWDTFEYYDGAFDNVELESMSQVQLYALMKVGLEQEHVAIGDEYVLSLGNDCDFDDVEEHVIIDKVTVFDGTKHIDTGLALFDEDRAFTVAIDYQMDKDNVTNNTLMQCFQGDGSNGFKLWWSGVPRLTWGTDSMSPSSADRREMVVIRHAKGSRTLNIYTSNLQGDAIYTIDLTAIRIPSGIASTLVFGCSKADDGSYENHAKGTIYWAKLWYTDVGSAQATKIASWVHEDIGLQVAKFKTGGYYLSDTSSTRANIVFLAKDLLSVSKPMSSVPNNTGGWADSALNNWLNTRLYDALPSMWKALIKSVKVNSSKGNKSTEISTANSMFFIPSVYEMDHYMGTEPYINETGAPISFITNETVRLRAKANSPTEYESYALRSPNVGYTTYYYEVNSTGDISGFSIPTADKGILLMFCIGA